MEKKISKVANIGVILSLLLSMALLFTGCGTSDNLENYIANDKDAAETFDTLSKTASASGLDIDVNKNTITYTYKYPQTYDDSTLDQMKEDLKATMDQASSLFENIADTFEKESGIDDVTVKLVYLNGNGTKICSKSY